MCMDLTPNERTALASILNNLTITVAEVTKQINIVKEALGVDNIVTPQDRADIIIREYKSRGANDRRIAALKEWREGEMKITGVKPQLLEAKMMVADRWYTVT